MNGVFTEKLDLSHDAMFEYMEAVLRKVLDRTNIGLAFNVMQKYVDRPRHDLFHVSCDRLAAFMVRRLSRHFVLRYDYGLYEYTTYIYKSPACL